MGAAVDRKWKNDQHSETYLIILLPNARDPIEMSKGTN